MKRERQADPLRLYIGFLSGPAAKESRISFFWRQRRKLTLLLPGKKSACDCLVFKIFTNLFHIDTEFPAPCEGQQRYVTGMRNVEFYVALSVTKTQGWLAGVRVAEHQLFWIGSGITGQDRPQHGTRGCEVLTISLKMKALRPRQFIRGKDRLPSVFCFGYGRQLDLP